MLLNANSPVRSARVLFSIAALGAILLTGCGRNPAPEACCDVIIKGGVILDGSGAPARIADLGVAGGRIAFIGDAGEHGAPEIIEADGLVVSPGFIDTHNHADEDIFQNPDYRLNENFLLQGVTTIVGGPDGFRSPSQLREIAEAIEKNGVGTNYAFYVGHNAIRQEVMGMDQRAPSEDELERMKSLVREGMELGAVGLSTGLMYEPGMFSKTDEVIELTKVVKPYYGVYDSHVRNPVHDFIGSDEEAIAIGEGAGGVPVKLGHLKAVGRKNAGRIDDVIKLVEAARAKGEDVVGDQYPYDGAATALLHTILLTPDESGAFKMQESLESVQGALRNSGELGAIRDATENGFDGGFAWIAAVGYGSLRIVDDPNDRAREGRYIIDLAEERAQTPFETVRALVLDSEAPILITLGAIEERDVRALIVQPWVMICSDGAYVPPGAPPSAGHPRSTGSFPRVLGHYVREEHVLELAEAVRKITSLPADFLRLGDRGRLAVGAPADITVFNPATIADRSTWVDPNAYPQGVDYVLVNGEVAVRDGAVTGVAAGEMLKRQTVAK